MKSLGGLTSSFRLLDDCRYNREIRAGIWIFILAGLIRTVFSICSYLALGREGLMGPDSHAFLLSAQFLAAGGGVFDSLPDHTMGGGFPRDFMPIAFWLMALTIEPTGLAEPLTFVLIQGWIDAASCLLIALMAAQLRFDAFVPAGILAALNPTQIIIASQVYADTIFLFFCLLTLLGGLMWFYHGNWLSTGIVGFGFAFALLTRPFILYWLPILAVLMIAGWAWLNRQNTGRALLQVCCIVIIVSAAMSPILLRNYSDFGRLALHAQTGSHLLFWVVPLVQESVDGTPRAVSKARGDELYETWAGPMPPENRPFLTSNRLSEIARSELARIGHIHVAAAWVKGMIVNLLAPASSVTPIVRALPHDSFFEMKAEGFFDKIVKFINQPHALLYSSILIISGLLMPFWLMLAGWGLTELLRKGRIHSVNALFLFIWCGYTLGVAGPVISPKYRLPLEGVWVVFTVIGFLIIRDLFIRHGSKKHGRTD